MNRLTKMFMVVMPLMLFAFGIFCYIYKDNIGYIAWRIRHPSDVVVWNSITMIVPDGFSYEVSQDSIQFYAWNDLRNKFYVMRNGEGMTGEYLEEFFTGKGFVDVALKTIYFLGARATAVSYTDTRGGVYSETIVAGEWDVLFIYEGMESMRDQVIGSLQSNIVIGLKAEDRGVRSSQ